MSQSSSQQFLLLFHYLNVAGVCPNSFDNASISGKNKLYIGFLGVFPTLYCIRQLYYLYNNHQDIAAFLLVVGGMVEWINFLLGIITPALNSTMIVKFFQIIEEAQETTISLDISQPTLPSQKTQIWYIVIFGIFPSVAAILAWAPYLSFYTIASIITLITVTFATLVKMKLMLLLLNSQFKNLNDKFKEVSDESMGISSKAEFDVDHFLFKLHNIKYVKPTDKSTGITVDQVLKFNKAHFQLCDAHKMLDSLFSLSILAETLFVSFLLVRAFTSVYHISLIGVVQLYGISFYTMFLFISVLSSATDVKNNLNMSQQLLTTFRYLNIAGVCPNSFDNDFISWKKKLYIGFLGVFPTYHFFLKLRDGYDNHQDITAFLLVVGVLVEWINFLLAIITPALNPNLIVKFFQIVEEAQKTITSLDISQPIIPSEKTQLWHISIFGILPVVATALVWAPYGTYHLIFSGTILLVVSVAALLKIKLMLLLLNSKFEILNIKFKKVSNESMTISSKTDFDVDNLFFKLYSIKYIKPKNGGSGITVDQILKFNKAHFQLCDAHKTLDSIFSLTALTGTLYVSFLLIVAFTTTANKHLLGVIHLYCCSFIIMFLFISILSSATDVKNNSQKTGYLVHELLNEELPFEVEEELQLFSRSLCLRKIGLSAQGFFMIDLKLLTKMVCTLAPLILIMVQRKHRSLKANIEL